MDENVRQRARKKLLRVAMPDGYVICHKSATMTFVEVLAAIGTSRFEEVQLENCHLPLLSREVYPRYRDWMKHVADGWYVNTQSDTDQKYMQLTSIKNQLGLQMEVEVGTDFITSDVKVVQRSKKRDNCLLVRFPNGYFVGGENPIDTFLEAIWKIGVEEIRRKNLEYAGKPLVTTTKQYNGQVQVDANRWLTVPPQTKDKYKMLRVVDAVMHLGLEVSII